MTLQEALKLSNFIKRESWSSGALYFNESNNVFTNTMEHVHNFSNEEILATDWVNIGEYNKKSDKILAAELVINLLKTLTEEINKSNNKIMEAVEAKDIVVTNSLISIQSELFEINKKLQSLTEPKWFIPHGTPLPPYGPIVTFTSDSNPYPIGTTLMQVGDQIKTGDATAPIATVTDVSWYKRGESNGKE